MGNQNIGLRLTAEIIHIILPDGIWLMPVEGTERMCSMKIEVKGFVKSLLNKRKPFMYSSCFACRDFCACNLANGHFVTEHVILSIGIAAQKG